MMYGGRVEQSSEEEAGRYQSGLIDQGQLPVVRHSKAGLMLSQSCWSALSVPRRMVKYHVPYSQCVGCIGGGQGWRDKAGNGSVLKAGKVRQETRTRHVGTRQDKIK